MASTTFTITGAVNVAVTITEMIDGSLKFDLKVLDDTGSIGDLNALYFDLANDSLTDGLVVDGADITGEVFKTDSVTKVDSYTNMNGEVIKDLGKFDGGVQFGTSGIGTDDIRETSFTLSHHTATLSLADFSLQDFGVRLTSVGEEGGSRDGSLKLGGTSPEFVEGPTVVANTDTLTVNEDASFNAPDFFDFLDSGASSVLANDTSDGNAYSGGITSVNGSADNVGQVIEGSNGGSIILYADGSFDFSASGADGVNDFDALAAGETATTSFTYGIEGGGADGILTVNILGLNDGGGPVEPPNAF